MENKAKKMKRLYLVRAKQMKVEYKPVSGANIMPITLEILDSITNPQRFPLITACCLFLINYKDNKK